MVPDTYQKKGKRSDRISVPDKKRDSDWGNGGKRPGGTPSLVRKRQETFRKENCCSMIIEEIMFL